MPTERWHLSLDIKSRPQIQNPHFVHIIGDQLLYYEVLAELFLGSNQLMTMIQGDGFSVIRDAA
jgi:hypothetical protein